MGALQRIYLSRHAPAPYDYGVSRVTFDVNVPHPARVWDY
jgi:hypothetical protein